MPRKPGHRIVFGCSTLAVLFALLTLFPFSGDGSLALTRAGTRDAKIQESSTAADDLSRAWEEDLSDSFEEDPADSSESTGTDAARPPRRNTNRLFMVMKPENGMGPPPGERLK